VEFEEKWRKVHYGCKSSAFTAKCESAFGNVTDSEKYTRSLHISNINLTVDVNCIRILEYGDYLPSTCHREFTTLMGFPPYVNVCVLGLPVRFNAVF
jgi:hypothetical protein